MSAEPVAGNDEGVVNGLQSGAVKNKEEARFAVEVLGPDHCRLVTRLPFKTGDVLAPIRIAQRYLYPGRHTLQVSESEHATLDPPQLALIDHACAPNARFDLQRGQVVALRDTPANKSVSVFYPATEWAMAAPFACGCGAPQCLGTIRGARDLPAHVLGRYELSNHIQRLLLTR